MRSSPITSAADFPDANLHGDPGREPDSTAVGVSDARSKAADCVSRYVYCVMATATSLGLAGLSAYLLSVPQISAATIGPVIASGAAAGVAIDQCLRLNAARRLAVPEEFPEATPPEGEV